MRRKNRTGEILGLADQTEMILILNPPYLMGYMALGNVLTPLSFAFFTDIWDIWEGSLAVKLYKETPEHDAKQAVAAS